MKKLKIAYFWLRPPELAFGGSVTHLVGVLSAFRELGHSVIIFLPKKIKEVKGLGKVYELGLYFNSSLLSLILYNFLSHKVKKILKKEKVDLIYQRHEIFSELGRKISKSLSTPLIIEFNNPFNLSVKYWYPINRILKLIALPFISYYEMKLLKGADGIVTVSSVLKNWLIKKGIKEEKIVVNPNGVNPAKFNPKIKDKTLRKKYGIPEEDILVGFVSTFRAWHGCEILAEAALKVIKKKQNVSFIFIGDGFFRKSTEDLVKSKYKGRKIIFTGAVPYKLISNYLSICDILVNPTKNTPDKSEFFGSPTKIFEYMGMGKAIISSNIGQMREILEHKKDAYLVEPDNPDALAQAIIELSENKELRMRIGRNARKKVVKMYTWKKNVENIIKFYNSLKR